jgi:hypothetical protein
MKTLLMTILLFSSSLFAEGYPVPYMNGCPSQYRSSGGYCVPTSDKFAIPRNGGCPSGFFASGTYCVATNSRYTAVPSYNGMSCPSGYFKSGNYCVKRGNR